MEPSERSQFQSQLLERRRQLEIMSNASNASEVTRLLGEVDEAIERIDKGTYGICEKCHDPIEKERLAADPLCCFCIDHLSPVERTALEDDLTLASRIQTRLLPDHALRSPAWEAYYYYKPLGPVSGDYCDLIASNPAGDEFFFLLGDVSGKGVAASLLVSHLHAMFRTLSTLKLPVTQMVEQANRLFCETLLPTHYATLICGRATAGQIELCNAGHCPPIVVSAGGLQSLHSTGVPLGLFCDSRYTSHKITPGGGDSLVLYTDGLTEATTANGRDYGEDRLFDAVRACHGLSPQQTIGRVVSDLDHFLDGGSKSDDLTMMAIRRA